MTPSAQRQELKAAAVLYRDGRFEDAESRYARVLADDAGSSDALARLGEIALHQNRPAEAVRLLQRAAERAPRLMRLWPFSSQLAVSEAMAHYRADQFAEAARLFRRAAGLVPVGPFGELKALGQHLECFGDDPPYVIAGPRESRVPFAAVDPLPVLTVSLCDRRPVLFFLDTGAAEVILDRQLAKEIGVQDVAQMTGESAGRKGVIGLGRLECISIGDFVVQNVPIHVLDMTHFAEVFGDLKVQGAIGTRLLMHFLATIDYVEGSLVLRRGGAGPGELPNPDIAGRGRKLIPFWLVHSHYLVALGTVNGTGPVLLLVDTGLAGKGFTAPAGTLQRAGIAIDWAAAQQGVAGFGKVRAVDFVLEELALGAGDNRFVQQSVPAVAMDPPLSVLGDRLGFHIAGCVSHQFFRRSLVTLDFVAMRLILDEGARSG